MAKPARQRIGDVGITRRVVCRHEACGAVGCAGVKTEGKAKGGDPPENLAETEGRAAPLSQSVACNGAVTQCCEPKRAGAAGKAAKEPVNARTLQDVNVHGARPFPDSPGGPGRRQRKVVDERGGLKAFCVEAAAGKSLGTERQTNI